MLEVLCRQGDWSIPLKSLRDLAQASLAGSTELEDLRAGYATMLSSLSENGGQLQSIVNKDYLPAIRKLAEEQFVEAEDSDMLLGRWKTLAAVRGSGAPRLIHS